MNQEIALTPPPQDESEKENRSLKNDHPSYGKLNLDVYSPSDLAVRLGCNRNTILDEILKGKLKSKKFGGPIGHRIMHADVMDWLNERS